MNDQASEPTEGETALWAVVSDAATRYDALDRERQALDAEIRVIISLNLSEIPNWRDLMQRRNRKVRAMAEASEAIEMASLQWAELQQRRP